MSVSPVSRARDEGAAQGQLGFEILPMLLAHADEALECVQLFPVLCTRQNRVHATACPQLAKADTASLAWPLGRKGSRPSFFRLLTRCLPGQSLLMIHEAKCLKYWRATVDQSGHYCFAVAL
jgi:hypothetical protein